jgi:Protein of unknown function (DUF2815)
MPDAPVTASILLHRKRIAFPALWTPKGIGEGAPAWGARFAIDPNDPEVEALDALVEKVAVDKWKEEGKGFLEFLKGQRKVAFEHAPYRSSTTGKIYDGFAGMFNLGTRSEKTKPTVFDKSGDEITTQQGVESLIYSGCYVHPKVEFWAQDNQYGKRINASLLGVMFAEHGAAFGGGSGPASADDFASVAQRADAEDVL